MRVGCDNSGIMDPTPRSAMKVFVFLALCVATSMQTAAEDGTSVCTPVVIDPSEYTVEVSSSQAEADPDLWCPDAADANPFRNVTMVNETKWALKILRSKLASDTDFYGYAGYFDSFITLPQTEGDYPFINEGKAVLQNDTGNNKIYYYYKFSAAVPFSALSFRPTTPMNYSDNDRLCMKTVLEGCLVEDLCPDVDCGAHGTCAGENFCACDSGFYGQNCFSDAMGVLDEVMVGNWERLDSQTVRTGVGKFSSSLQSGGFEIKNGIIILTGQRSAIFSDEQEGFQCLVNPDSCSSFSVSFTFALDSLDSGVIGLFGKDNADVSYTGLHAWLIQEDNDLWLHVVVRRTDAKWVYKTVVGSFFVGEWTVLEISWDVQKGLYVFFAGSEGRQILNRNTEATVSNTLVLGCPFYKDDTVNYNVSMAIRKFSYSYFTRWDVLGAAAAMCPLGCDEYGMCSGNNYCTCLAGSAGPLCQFGESGTSMSSVSIEGNVLMSSAGNFTIENEGVSVIDRGFHLQGVCHLTTSEIMPEGDMECLVGPDECNSTGITLSVWLSVFSFNDTTYILSTNYGTGDAKGVNLVLETSLLLTLQIDLPTERWRLQYPFQSQDELTRGVLLEFTFTGTILELYVNNLRVGLAENAIQSLTASSLVRRLRFGASYSGDSTFTNYTLQELSVTRQNRSSLVMLVKRKRAAVFDTDTSPTESTTTGTTTDGSTGMHCQVSTFSQTKAVLLQLGFEVLTISDATKRAEKCTVLLAKIKEATGLLETCWKSGASDDDSSSFVSFLKFTELKPVFAFKSICDADNTPEVLPSECDATTLREQISAFYTMTLEYAQGEDRCSLLWVSFERVSKLMKNCGPNSFVQQLKQQMGHVSAMACSPSTCNVDYALACLGAAKRVMSDNSLVAGQGQCQDLKLSLACATNHTVDCNGPSYSFMFKAIGEVQNHYRQVCNVSSSEPTSSEKLTKTDSLKMLQLAAYGGLLDAPVLCNMWQREEWQGEEATAALSPFGRSLLKGACKGIAGITLEERPVCPCDYDVSEDDIRASVIGASDCSGTEATLRDLFGKVRGCSGFMTAAKNLSSHVNVVCNTTLGLGNLACPSKCNTSACFDDACGDVSDCLAFNAQGCSPHELFSSGLVLQTKRDLECSLHNDPVIQLPKQSSLTKVLQCVRPVAARVSVEAVMLGEYCNSMKALHNCLEKAQEEAEEEDELLEMAISHSRSVVKMIEDTVCKFMPETACGYGSKADVVFVLDSSGSIGTSNFQLLLNFMSDLFNEWDVGQDSIRISALRYSSDVKVEFDLNAFADKEGLLEAVGQMDTNTEGGTLTGEAIRQAREQFSPDKGDRSDVQDIIVLITDGKSSNEDHLKEQAEKAKEEGIVILAVGVGNGVDEEELESAASSPIEKHVFSVQNYTALTSFMSDFKQLTCSVISDFARPFNRSVREEECPASKEILQDMEDTFLSVARGPFYTLQERDQLCSQPLEDKNFTACKGSEQQYLGRMYNNLQKVVAEMCRMHEPVKGCDVEAASGCMKEMAQSFMMPGVSSCALYPKVEVCVKKNLIYCASAVGFHFKSSLERFKKLAESTCSKGVCDPTEAVLCLTEIHHMSKSLTPDWNGICSKVDADMECAKKNVEGCDKCQRDTVKTISGKIALPLLETCKEPPETECKAMAAYSCKDKLLGLLERSKETRSEEDDSKEKGSKEKGSKETRSEEDDSKEKGSKVKGSKEKGSKEKHGSGSKKKGSGSKSRDTSDKLICLDVFEARQCISELTMECDDIVKMTVNADLEEIVRHLDAEDCRQDSILPVCQQTLADLVGRILSYDPLDPADPVHKYRKESQGKSDDNDSKDKGSKDKGSKDKGSKDKGSKDKGSNDKDSGSKGKKSGSKEVEFPPNYLGKMCTDAKLAFDCVTDSLIQFPPASIHGLADTLNVTWALAKMICEEHLEPLSCFKCDNATNNLVCNNGTEICITEYQMCKTEVKVDEYSVITSITKGCVFPPSCKPGCEDEFCTYCCDTELCNEPDDGPIVDTCNLVQVSGCLSEMSAAFLDTDTIDCSLVKEKTACIEYSLKECQAAGKTEVVEKLSGFLKSKTVATCEVQLSDSRCGLYAVSALASFLGTASYVTQESETYFCPLLLAVEREKAIVEKSENCDDHEVKAMSASLALFKSQLSFCRPGDDPMTYCESLATECLEIDDSCNIEKSLTCIEAAMQGCQPVQRLTSYLMLSIMASGRQCDVSSIPSMPEEFRPLDICLRTFTASFSLELSRGGLDLSVTVTELAGCLLKDWDLNLLLELSPAYKLYLQQIILFLYEVLLPAVQLPVGHTGVNFTDECVAALHEASVSYTSEALLLLMRPLGSRNPNFCKTLTSLEVKFSSSIVACLDEELVVVRKLETHLIEHRSTVCPDVSVQRCSVESAHSCLQQFTTLMDNALTKDDHICKSLTHTLDCVARHTSNCHPEKARAVNIALYSAASVYKSSCPDVMAAICKHSNLSTVVENPPADCNVNTTTLDHCDATPVGISCSSAEEVSDCYRKEVSSCTEPDAAQYRERFASAFPGFAAYAPGVCGINYTSWSFSNETCYEPVCDVAAAYKCYNTSATFADAASGQVYVDEVASCLVENLAGCDVWARAFMYYEVYLWVETTGFDFTLTLSYGDPMHKMVLLLNKFILKLDWAFKAKKWDLLPLCWMLQDFSIELDKLFEVNPLFSSVFSRGHKGLKNSLSGVCNDLDVVSVILDLPALEDENCPAAEIRQSLTNATFQAVVTSVLQQEARMDFCDLLKKIDSFNLDTCSPGLRHQMNLMMRVIEELSGMVCKRVQYCSAERVQRCATDLVLVVQGIGTNSSTQQVCSSIHLLDKCVEQFSFHCDDTSLMQISSSVKSIRHLAVGVCGKEMPVDNLPTCVDAETANTCSADEVKDCSLQYFLGLLSSLADDNAHCRSLQQSRTCFDRVERKCVDSTSWAIGGKLPEEKNFEWLKNRFNCEDSDDSDEEIPVCVEGCLLVEAKECISTLSMSLRVSDVDACSVVTQARQCLILKTHNCSKEVVDRFHEQLENTLYFHASLTAQCEDVYSCFADFADLGRQILSKDDMPEPKSSSKEKGSKENGSKGKGSKEKDSNKGSKPTSTEAGSKEEEEGFEDDNLIVLCQRFFQAAECTERDLSRLPKDHSELLTRILKPLQDVVKHRCSRTKQLECLTCEDADHDDECSDVERCKHKEVCGIIFTIDSVTRGCMNEAHCHAKDKKDTVVNCCRENKCNNATNVVIRPDMEVEKLCYVSYAIDCAFSFAESLISRGSVLCSNSMENLQCVVEMSTHCPFADSLRTAAGHLMLSLAETKCVQGPPPEGCNSITVQSTEAILTNPYAVNSICEGLNQSIGSIDYLESSQKCTYLDLLGQRVSLTSVSQLVYSTCHPDDCTAVTTEVSLPKLEEEKDEEKDCTDVLGPSRCAHDALEIYETHNGTNSDEVCSKVHESARCAATSFEGCELTGCLKALIEAVKSSSKDICDIDLSAPVPDPDDEDEDKDDQEECQPSGGCYMLAAAGCVKLVNLSQSQSEQCRQLEEAYECRSKNMKSCISIQDAYVGVEFDTKLRSVIKACNESTKAEPEPKVDVYSDTASCLSNFMGDLMDALEDEYVTDACSAASEFKACPDDSLTKAVQDFVAGGPISLADALLENDDVCGDGGRRRRSASDSSCSLSDRRSAILQIVTSLSMNVTGVADRPNRCWNLVQAVDTLQEQISKGCHSDKSRAFMEVFKNFGSDLSATYCDVIEYTPAGCKPEMFPTCFDAFSSVCPFARTEPGTQCRAAKRALSCMQKFSQNCEENTLSTVSKFKDYVKSVVGNSCPDLTLGLFCPQSFPQVSYNYSCNYLASGECLMEADDLSPLSSYYCRDLSTNVQCVRHNLQGCLASQVNETKHASAKLKEMASVHCPAEVLAIPEYSDICVAEKACSIGDALPCLQMEKSSDEEDCSFLSRVWQCVEETFTSCAGSSEAKKGVFGFFNFQYKDRAAGCTGLQTPAETFYCSGDFLKDLKESLLTNRSLSSVCMTLSNFMGCVKKNSQQSDSFSQVLKRDLSYVEKVKDIFCNDDSAAVSEQGEQCNLLSASHCLAQEMSWVLDRHFFTRADNQKFCYRWNQQYTRSCMIQHMEACSTDMTELLNTVLSMSTRLVTESRACEPLNMCYMEEAYFHINEFAVNVSNIHGHAFPVILCSQKAKVEANVHTFTATCSQSQKTTIQKSLKRVTSLVSDLCEDVELPAPPLCPNLPQDQKQCNIGDAFSCVIQFSTHLLSHGPSLLWRDWCLSLERTIRCAAINTSSCDSTKDNFKMVTDALDEFRQQAGTRCPWLSDDLCSRTMPCGVQFAGCDVKLQVSLIDQPLADVCSLISEADQCVIDNTERCTRPQVLLAERTIARRKEDLAISDLNCDGTEVAPCLMQARAASWQVLTLDEDRTEACDTLNTASSCLTSRMNDQSAFELQFISSLVTGMLTDVNGLCGVNGSVPCGRSKAELLNTVFDWVIQVAGAKTFDNYRFCSTRQAVLSNIDVVEALYQSCNFLEFNELKAALTSDKLAEQCGVSGRVNCSSVQSEFEECKEMYESGNCSTARSALLCMARMMGQLENCDGGDPDSTTGQYDAFRSSLSCNNLVPIILLTSTKEPLYVAEEGSYAKISFRMPSTNFSGSGVQIRAQVSGVDSPTCLSDASEEIPQLSVLFDSNEPCGFSVTANTGDEVHTFKLVANQDMRQDGLRKALVTLYADILDEASESFKVAEYEVHIKDSDISSSSCSSVGDPHISSFDGVVYNTFQPGSYTLYRNTFYPVAVTVDYQQCADEGTCTCAVDVWDNGVRVRFDRCRRVGQFGQPEVMEASMPEHSGDIRLHVYRLPDDKGYIVLLPTGTQVIVKPSGHYLAVYIKASGLDLGKTEGLCGMYDGDAYNDLIKPNGQRYSIGDNDMRYGVLSPRSFISSWLVEEAGILSENAKLNFTSTCSCSSSSQEAAQCGMVNHVATCDFVQGQEIASDLAQSTFEKRRRRRALADPIDFSITPTQREMGWPTSSGWTKEKAEEKCEEMLDEAQTLQYCSRAILIANGNYSVQDIITTCVENVRLSDSLNYLTSSMAQAEEKCKYLFLRNPAYQEAARPAIIEFLQHTCTNNCNGNGNCQMGVCHCFPGFVGGDCSYRRTQLPRPTGTSMHRALCEVSEGERCEDIYITGQDLVNSAYLSCHIQSVMVTSSGQQRPLETSIRVPATLITGTLAYCRFSLSRAAQQTMTVAISNDGEWQADPMLFTIYDPRCYSCHSVSHFCTAAVQESCEINGQCYMPQEVSKLDNCLECNPSYSDNRWSIKNLPECSGRKVDIDEDDSDDNNRRFSPIHAVLIGCVVAVLVIAVVIIVVVIKKRNARKSVDQEDGRLSTSAYDNPAYVTNQDGQSVEGEPQEPFRHGSVHKRAVTAMTNNTPAMTEGENINY